MRDQPRIAVIYYSATGHVHRLAEAFGQGATDAGAEVRLRRVPELAGDAAIDANPAWRAHLEGTADVEVAGLDDLVWADGLAFGTPTRFGNVSSQLKQFLDTTSGLWLAGELANKPATGFTASMDPHGGQESTLLALYHTMFHWGSVIVPPGWVDYEIAHAAGGNPYGISQVEAESADPGYVKAVLEAARRHGHRLVDVARALAPLRAA
ncbi:MAG TPA: NAD(P)H:quinone oxidoreductase [Pseudonocardia sp.]|uniref:NAD(P)H:quinone oxidoreductase n=1 Tax=Pseudonocardia sp. TaxID=60912 RepID=UPI002B4AD109|nr:NAD(P)H:quinone oxidoreductase [Pseudonocardia sp.]HLU56707.1 NAD(P)H:quinone oxidoreductase [Pseudonocardia sp.]